MRFFGKNNKAFTVIELVIVVGIIVILVAAIFVSVDPIKRSHESRNAHRFNDVKTILGAVENYKNENNGALVAELADVSAGKFVIIGHKENDDTRCAEYDTAALACAADSSDAGDADCIALTQLGDSHLESLPFDPKSGDLNDTKYYISRDSNNEITVGACDSEGEGSGGSGIGPIIELSTTSAQF